MKALKLLQELDYQVKRDVFKNVPEHAISKTKFSDKTAAALTKSILTFLKLKGHMHWRQSSEGRYRPGHQYIDVLGRIHLGKGQYLPGTNKGHADVCSIIHGTFCAVEIKMKDSQSLAQKQYQQQVEDNGGRYVIVRTFENFYTWYQQNTK